MAFLQIDYKSEALMRGVNIKVAPTYLPCHLTEVLP